MPNRDLSVMQDVYDSILTAYSYISHLSAQLKFLKNDSYIALEKELTINKLLRKVDSLYDLCGRISYSLLVYAEGYSQASGVEFHLAEKTYNGPQDFNYVQVQDNRYQNYMMELTSDNESFVSYWKRTLKQLALGDYTDEVTEVGTFISLLLSFTGIDDLMDLRDLKADINKGDTVGATLNFLALLPVVGTYKPIKKAAEALIEGGDATHDLYRFGKTVNKFDSTGDVIKASNRFDSAKDTSKAANKFDSAKDTSKAVKTIDNANDLRKGANAMTDTSELIEHLLHPKFGSKSNPISGGHEKQALIEFIEKNGGTFEATPYPNFDGIELIKYKRPYENEMYEGYKTVYVISENFSTDDYVRRAMEAANDAAEQNGGILPHKWFGKDSKGVEWTGYNSTDPTINRPRTAYPLQ